jgi:hypothetical protein
MKTCLAPNIITMIFGFRKNCVLINAPPTPFGNVRPLGV